MKEKIKIGRSDIIVNIGDVRIRILLDRGFFNIDEDLGPQLHSHNYYEMHFVFEDHIEFETKNGKIYIGINDICIFPCGMPYSHAFKCCKWQHISLRFSVKRIAKRDEQYSDAVFAALRNVQILRNVPLFALKLKEIISETYSDRLFSEERVAALFTLLFSCLFEHLISDISHDKTPHIPCNDMETDMRFIMLKEYFTYNYMRDVVLSDLAEQLKLSEKQTQGMIQNIYGNTFKEQLVYQRLAAAKILLTDTDEPVKKVATLVGYKSYGGFYSLFSREIGMTPMEYRKKKRYG